jgi:hypothetical protein
MAGAGLALLLPALALADTAKLAGDAYVNAGDGINYGELPTVNVGGAANSSGLLLFSLSTLPSTTGVAWARLRVYVDKVNTAGTLDLGTASAAWTEAAVNGSSGIAVGSPIGTAAVGATGYVTFDVTAQAAAWLSGAPNYGFILTPDASTPNLSIIIDSKENVATSHPAVLEVVFSGAAGSVGPDGAPGPSGAPGAAGVAGALGPAGATGPSGVAGATGAAGLAGAAGPNGATGPNGPTGAAGATGAAGLAGAIGPTGATGAVGATGSAGAAGLAGAAGATGPNGAPGSAGATGAAGPAFSNVFSVSASSGTYAISDTTTDSIFFTTSGNTVTLPHAASLTGRKIWVAMTNIGGANFFTVSSSSPNIYTFGAVGVSSVTFKDAVQLYSDGSRWNAAYTNQ